MKSLAYYLQIGAASSSLLVGLIYITYNRNKGLFKKLLGVVLITTAIGLIISFVAINNYFQILPHLSRTGFIFVLLVPPLIYITFFNGLLDKTFQKIDYLHFLPVLVYIINFTPYFLSSAEEKLALLKLNQLGIFKEGWLLPPHFVPLMSFIQTTFYFLLFIFKAKELHNLNIPKIYLEKYLYFTCYITSNYLPILLMYLGYYERHEIGGWLPVAYALINISFFLKIITSPSWLFNNIELDLEKAKKQTKTDLLLQKIELRLKARMDKLSMSDICLLNHINTICQEDLLFLKHDFNQKNLAKLIDVSEYKIRVLFEKAYDLNFVEFNNYQKIKFLLIKHQQNIEEWKQMKMGMASERLGYKSLNSFYLNFKKIAGVTPGDFFNTK